MRALLFCSVLISAINFFLPLFASPALATDGVLEINQTCALQTGCFAGDTPGFPVTIDGTAGRSYSLTSDLTVPDENTDGIVISASSISVDLNGFEIAGPVTCSGSPPASPLVCNPASGSGSGLKHLAGHGLSVRNGSITGMGSSALFLRFHDQAEVMNLRIRWNALGGIRAGQGSTVSGTTAYQNGRLGIRAGQGSTVSGNTAYQNGGDGIKVLGGSTVSGNSSYRNAGNGISGDFLDGGVTFIGNTVYGNSGNGISGFLDAPVPGSTISNNTASDNNGDGIYATGGSNVQGNTVRNNDRYGLNLDFSSSAASYRDNTITTDSNSLGTVRNGINAGGNVCNGSLTCP